MKGPHARELLRGGLVFLLVVVSIGHVCALPASQAVFPLPETAERHESGDPHESHDVSCEATLAKTATPAALALAPASCVVSGDVAPILGVPMLGAWPSLGVSALSGGRRPPLFLLHATLLI